MKNADDTLFFQPIQINQIIRIEIRQFPVIFVREISCVQLTHTASETSNSGSRQTE